MKPVYLALCILGIALPFSQFVPWLADNGIDIPLLWDHLTANRISTFAWLDVIVAALAVIAFAWREGRGAIDRWWLPILATLAVGPSLGLPLFLYLRADAPGPAAAN